MSVNTVLKYKRLGQLGAISLLKDMKTDTMTWRWRHPTKVLDYPKSEFRTFKEFEDWVITNHG